MTSCVMQIVKVFEQILYAADEKEAKEVGMAQSVCNSKAVRHAVKLCLSWALALGICCRRCAVSAHLLHMQVMSQAMMQHVQQPAQGT